MAFLAPSVAGDTAVADALRLLAWASDPDAVAARLTEVRAAEAKLQEAAAGHAAREATVAAVEAGLVRRIDEAKGEFVSLAAARSAAEKSKAEADALVARIRETLAND
jgi:hypothetical protein